MSTLEQELNNYKIDIDYLDSIERLESGVFSVINPTIKELPDFIRIAPLGKIANLLDKLGNEHYSNRKYKAAELSFTRELKALLIKQIITPESPGLTENISTAHFNLANTVDELKQYNFAIYNYTQAAALGNKDPASVFNNRGQVYEKLNKLDDAEIDLRYAEELNPYDIKINTALVRVLRKKKSKKCWLKRIFSKGV